MNTRDNFAKAIVEALAKRSSYICSNPSCRSLTLFPSSSDPTKFLFLGVAAHITAARKGGPRYDSALSAEERSSTDNGVFLCTSCATLIDKQGGIDLPVEVLRKWKHEHELWISANLNKSIESLSSLVQIAEEKQRRQNSLECTSSRAIR